MTGPARLRRLVLTWLAGLTALVALVLGSGLWLERATRIDQAGLALPSCLLVEDRTGRPLRFIPDRAGERHLRAEGRELPEPVRLAFVAAEDRRFFSHPGVDLLALGRALRDNLLSGRVVSGASTITQQLCRLGRPRPRTLLAKGLEALTALRLEAFSSKEEILTSYLNLVPLGNNLRGVKAGAWLYFGLAPDRLSPAQAALLAALPKSPSRLNPYGPGLERLKERRDRILARMAELEFLDQGTAASAAGEPPGVRPRAFPFEAAHAVDSLLVQKRLEARQGLVRTSIDLDLQQRLEKLLAAHRARLAAGGAVQAAAVILANQGPEVLALAGSLAYGQENNGFVNGAEAERSPGSLLKPFLYARALDLGFSPAQVLEDTPRSFRSPLGEFRPANFDRRAYGPVPFREALGSSLNLSAVSLLNRIGLRDFHQTLEGLELIARPEAGAGRHGLGLVVGSPEVSLVQVAAAYACLANGGLFRPASFLAGEPPGAGRRIFSPQASHLISQILADPSARALTFGRSRAMNPSLRAALKTGTSTNFRDCWVVGYTPDLTVAVWTGNFDGRPTQGLSGAGAAAPILAELLDLLHGSGPPRPFPRPEGLEETRVCSQSGLLPGPHCLETRTELFIQGAGPDRTCDFHEPDGTVHRLPPVFAGWLSRRFEEGLQGRYRLAGFDPDLGRTLGPGPPAGSSSPSPSGLAGGISIIQPLDGDRFVQEGSGPAVTFRARVTQALGQVTWFVDGRELARTGPPYEAAWPPTRGTHQVMAVGPDGRGDSITIKVE